MLNKTLFFLIYFFCFFTFGYSQVESIAEAQALYPDANAIFLSKSDHYKVYYENGVLKGTCTTQEEVFINKEYGINYQTRKIPTNSFVEAKNIKAFTLLPKGKKFEKKEVEKIQLTDDPGRSSFYDDEKAHVLTFPYAQVGSVLSMNYQLQYHEPRFMGHHYWIDYIPCLKNELIISVNKNIKIEYKLMNCEKLKLEFTKEEKKDEIIYRWKLLNSTPTISYDDAPNLRYFEPHLIFYVTEYEINGKKDLLLGTTKELYGWYRNLQKNLNKTEDARLKKIADSLVVGVNDEFEKVKRIYYWVQDNISYVAFEDGLGGFIPRDAGVVCTKKYGDCKDMASIINEMLRMVGITSYPTWIGSRDIPYTYAQIPTPSVDNHMIATYKDKNGKWYFLDATGKNASIDVYTSMIQGKEGLVGVTPDSFSIITVPIKDTSVSQTLDSISIKVKDNVLIGSGKAILTGYDRLDYIYRTERLSKAEYFDYFKGYFNKGSNKINFANITSPIDENRELIKMTYDFDIPDYVKQNHNEMYINLNLDNGLILEQLSATRDVPVYIRHKTKKILVTTMEIPENYKVDFLPANAIYKNNVAGFESLYIIKGNTIIHVNTFYINTLMLMPADFEKFNTVLKEQIKSNKQAISLIKK